jgi:hypothetical protein
MVCGINSCRVLTFAYPTLRAPTHIFLACKVTGRIATSVDGIQQKKLPSLQVSVTGFLQHVNLFFESASLLSDLNFGSNMASKQPETDTIFFSDPYGPPGQERASINTAPSTEPQRGGSRTSCYKPNILPIQSDTTTIEHRMDPFKATRISGQWIIIIGHGALATLPMLVLSAAILFMVISYSIKPHNMDGHPLNSYYFLQKIPVYSLLTLTTCTAILSLLFIPSLLVLTSFIHAHDILRLSEDKNFASLPTTFEFGLLLRVITGSPVAYLRGVQRVFRRPYKKYFILRRAVILSTVISILWFVIFFPYL